MNALEKDSTYVGIQEARKDELTIENFNLIKDFANFKVDIINDFSIKKKLFL